MTRFIGPVIVLALGGAPAFGDEVFSAREFLYTRVFKMGSDLFPERPPVALSPQGIYLGGSFFIPPTAATRTRRKPRASYGSTMQWVTRSGRARSPARDVFPSLMAADATSLYVAGSIGFGKTDFFVGKYDEDGNECGPVRRAFRRAAITS